MRKKGFFFFAIPKDSYRLTEKILFFCFVRLPLTVTGRGLVWSFRGAPLAGAVPSWPAPNPFCSSGGPKSPGKAALVLRLLPLPRSESGSANRLAGWCPKGVGSTAAEMTVDAGKDDTRGSAAKDGKHKSINHRELNSSSSGSTKKKKHYLYRQQLYQQKKG